MNREVHTEPLGSPTSMCLAFMEAAQWLLLVAPTCMTMRGALDHKR